MFISSGLFDNLTSLTLADPLYDEATLATLLAPQTALRRRLKHLNCSWDYDTPFESHHRVLFFLFEALEYFDSAVHARVRLPSPYSESYYAPMDDGAESWEAHEPLQREVDLDWTAAPSNLVRRARSDWTTFQAIWYDNEQFYRAVGRLILRKPPSSSPFSSLLSLSLHIESERLLFLLFYTAPTPLLKHVTLRGEITFLFPETIRTMLFSLTRFVSSHSSSPLKALLTLAPSAAHPPLSTVSLRLISTTPAPSTSPRTTRLRSRRLGKRGSGI
jgi:hypothetical protein